MFGDVDIFTLEEMFVLLGVVKEELKLCFLEQFRQHETCAEVERAENLVAHQCEEVVERKDTPNKVLVLIPKLIVSTYFGEEN